jgi:shikimate kinase
MRHRHVVLVGLMGSGKSSIGKPLAARLGLPYVDNDTELERRTGATARDLAARAGTDALHGEEAAALHDVLDRSAPSVVGAAASVVCDPEIRALLREHFVVWLNADLDTLVSKLAAKAHRPVVDGDPRAYLEQQLAERGPLYREVASMVVDTDRDRDDDAIVDRIVAALQ